MTPSFIQLSRRHFIAAAGMSALAAKAFPNPNKTSIQPGFAFAASAGKLHAYSTHEREWSLLQTIPSEAPISLVADPSTHTLHVLHAVSQHRGLPCGYIESFRILADSAQLMPLSTQPLSLSAVDPRHMALSPDGKAIAVAIHGGAAYNLLPILKDGSLGRPYGLRKETGLNIARPSRPAHIVFDTSGDHFFALDQGTSTLSVFSAQPEMPVLSRLSLLGAKAPVSLTSYAQANLLFVVDADSGSLLTVRYNPADASLSCVPKIIQNGFLGAAAVHAASKTLFLVAADSIHAYRIQAETGELTLLQRLRNASLRDKAQHLLCDPAGNVLYLAESDNILRSNIEPNCGALSPLTRVAPAAQVIALL